MSTNYISHISSPKSTPQNEPIPGKTMVMNNAGGFIFAVDDWTRLDRFLLIGCQTNTYYQTAKALTKDNAACVQRCLDLDPQRTVSRIVEISEAGRAPKNDQAVFALALAAAHPKGKEFALGDALPRICRIGTHLFQFADAVDKLRGWGRSLRNAIANWYLQKKPEDIVFQCIKYQQREGWSHRDLMRLSHLNNQTFKPGKELYRAIYHWVSKGWESVGEVPHPQKELLPIWAMEKAKRSTDKKEIVKLIRDYNMVRECIPTQFLTEPEVWEALLEKMPMTAMVRNLATMTRVGLLTPMSSAVKKVMDELTNVERIKKSRLHPIAILNALLTYKAGRGDKSKHTWDPVAQIVDALDQSFYLAFGNVTATNKRWMLALDVSGSMDSGTIAGVPGLTPRVGSAGMALVTANVESSHCFIGFTSNGNYARPSMWGNRYQSGITPLSISPKQRIDDVCNYVSKLPMGGTDCSLPMIYASETKLPIDVFVVLTDSETWSGNIAPCQALTQYRQKMGIPAKLIVVGMTSTGFTIADPNDGGMMDVVGFDSAAPQIMSDFAVS